MTSRRVVLLAAVVCLFVGLAAPAGAHAYLVDASPENGEQLSEPPDAVVLEYTEGVQLADVSVLDADGADVGGEATVDGDEPTVVRAPVDDLDDGVYVVRWEVLSGDGHTTSGSFLFTVGEERPDREQLLAANAPDERTADGVETVTKGALLLGLVGLLGVPLTLVAAVYPVVPAGRRLERRSRRLLVAAAALFLAGAALLGVARLAGSHGVSLEGIVAFVATPLGMAWLIQVAVGGALVAVLSGGRLTARNLYGCLALATLGAVAVSATSHSASVEGVAGIVFDLAHLFGAGTWLGGLLALGVLAPAALSALEDPASAAAEMLRRFSVVAVAGVTVAFASGFFLASWHLPDLRAPETSYEGALALKTALVVAALGVAGLVRAGVHRRLAAPPSPARGPIGRLSTALGAGDDVAAFVRGVRIEAAILVAVVLLSGLLTSAPTAAVLAADDAGPTVVEADADGYELELRVTPSEVGPNSFDLYLSRDGEPAAAEEVTLRFRERASGDALPQVELRERRPGAYSRVATVPNAGYWDVRVNVWTGDAYVTSETELFVASAGDAGHVHAADPVRSLQAIGLLVGLVGTVALGRELWLFERRRER